MKANFKGVGGGGRGMEVSWRSDAGAGILRGEQELASSRNEEQAWAKVQRHEVAWECRSMLLTQSSRSLEMGSSGGQSGGVGMG